MVRKKHSRTASTTDIYDCDFILRESACVCLSVCLSVCRDHTPYALSPKKIVLRKWGGGVNFAKNLIQVLF